MKPPRPNTPAAFLPDLPREIRRYARLLALAATVYAALLLVFASRAVDPLVLLQDAGDDETYRLHEGLLSNLGVFGWIATAAILLFATTARHARGPSAATRLLLCGGVLSALLAVDDFFLLHDRYVPQSWAYATYAALGLAIVAGSGRTLLRFGGAGVFLAGGLLAGSILVDVLQNHLPVGYRAAQIAEEGLKFAGIACWLAAWSRVAATALQPVGE